MDVEILCIIPARCGSKSIPNKNIKNFRGKPLLAWSIEQIKQSIYSTNIKILVCTDSEEYAEIAIKHGAEVPFIRPENISGDNSNDIEFIKYTVEWLNSNENYYPDFILHMRPTQPLRSTKDIDNSIKLFRENINNYDSLRSVIPVTKSPFKMYTVEKDELIPLFRNFKDISEPFNVGRQQLPIVYAHNGYIDIIKTSILENDTISGSKILPYIMDEEDCCDLDTLKDWYYYNNIENAENSKSTS